MNQLEKEVKRMCKEYAKECDSGMEGFISELRQGGCASGLIGDLVYYEDTTKFYNNFETEIWEVLFKCADKEYTNPMKFIASLSESENVGNMEQLKNLLVWFAFEETAFQLFSKEQDV
jgi:hypothetical protein